MIIQNSQSTRRQSYLKATIGAIFLTRQAGRKQAASEAVSVTTNADENTSGARSQGLPEEFPFPSKCWRRLRDWEEQGVWLNIWRAFLGELNEHQQLPWSESFLQGSFAPAKNQGSAVGTTCRGKSTKWMVVVDGHGVPLGVPLYSVSPSEVRLAEETLATFPMAWFCDRGVGKKPGLLHRQS